MTNFVDEIQNAIDLFCTELQDPDSNPYIEQPRSESFLLEFINPKDDLQEAVNLSLHVLQRMQNPDERQYTAHILAEVLQPFTQQILMECGTDAFDLLNECWDTEGFTIAVEHEHWKGAALILQRFPADPHLPNVFKLNLRCALEFAADRLEMHLDNTLYTHVLIEQVATGINRKILSNAVQRVTSFAAAKKKM